MAEESSRFAKDLVLEAHAWASDYVQKAYQEPLRGESFVRWLRSMMWREYKFNDWFIKEIHLLSDDLHDIRYSLSLQIHDEFRHSRVFSRRLRELGEDGELMTYRPTESEWYHYRHTLDWDHPAAIAASGHCCGEVLLSVLLRHMVHPKHPLVDEVTAQMIEEYVMETDKNSEQGYVDERTAELLSREVIPDEGPHIRNGRMIIERLATSDDIQALCREAFEKKRESLQNVYAGSH